ncbi:MAG: hypothetical protein DMG88_07665 [Acidobacteria bacterium]|nr:MAG: hypothetical protein DMG88_07665 [Acidobacteriota bacterium]
MPRVGRFLTLLMLSSLFYAQSDPAPVTNTPEVPQSVPGAANLREHDPLLDLPPLPRAKISLLGGTITRLDRVQDHLTIQPFGAKQKMNVAFDVRTRFFRDGQPSTQRDVKVGQRVYLDTMLNGTTIFAKSIWIDSNTAAGSGRGQILSYDPQHGVLTLRDELSAQPIRFNLGPDTLVRQGSQTRSVADLKPGALISLTFGPEQGGRGAVLEVSILAQPGTQFSFFGRITYMDLSRKLIAVANESDNTTYEIYLESLPPGSLRDARQGAEVTVSAVFDGKHYVARSIELARTSSSSVQ